VKTTQCLWYALDRWNQEGGYLALRKSAHWCMPHVLHIDKVGRWTHFVPPHDLPTPILSLFGFDGNIQTADSIDAKPISSVCMFLGTMALVVLGGVWALKTWGKKLFRW